MPPKTRRMTSLSASQPSQSLHALTYSLPTMPVEVLPNILVEELTEELSSLIGIEDANMADANDVKTLRTEDVARCFKNIGSQQENRT